MSIWDSIFSNQYIGILTHYYIIYLFKPKKVSIFTADIFSIHTKR